MEDNRTRRAHVMSCLHNNPDIEEYWYPGYPQDPSGIEEDNLQMTRNLEQYLMQNNFLDLSHFQSIARPDPDNDACTLLDYYGLGGDGRLVLPRSE